MKIGPILAAARLGALLGPACAFAELDRPYTLRNQEPRIVEHDREALIRGDSRFGFASPGPSSPESETHPSHLAFPDSSGGSVLRLKFLGGEEYRYTAGHHGSTEAGAIAYGRKAMVSFRLDARMFAEQGDAGPSYDREDVDSQDEAKTGSISYTSYSRYRGDLSVETRAGTLSVRRDAAQWGPAVFNNLAFQQDAVPFDQFVYEATVGPVRIVSLYGDLIIGDSPAFSKENLEGRHLYAHRYELALARRWLVGVSEQLFLYGTNRPYLFAPIFPLFMAKGFMYEEANNGNLAADLCYRLPGRGLFYSEFLLDDMESPSSLFTKDYAQNKWGWLAGTHLTFAAGPGTLGLIGEYARLEPWVYAHFTPGTAQASHVGIPLGNPYGPNSQNATLKVYWRAADWYAGATQSLAWKGSGPGSQLDDPAPHDAFQPKSFLSGAGDPEYSCRPEAYVNLGGLALAMGAEFGARTSVWSGIRYFY